MDENNEKQAMVGMAELEAIKEERDADKERFEARIKQLTDYQNEQKSKFTQFYEDFKAKLDKSNTAGRQFRAQVQKLQPENETNYK